MMKIMSRHLILTIFLSYLLLLAGSLQASNSDGSDLAWTKLQEGTAIAIMRHALAPGTGDPAGFTLDDCSTQRNLSDKGRDQARAIGDLFREKGVTRAEVFTSEWCRCQETARLLDLGTPERFPAMNSFFQNRQEAQGQTRRLLDALPAWLEQGSPPTVLVTHQVNISALTGSFTSSGEILIIHLADGVVEVLASIQTLN